jgi:hypothetical protein
MPVGEIEVFGRERAVNSVAAPLVEDDRLAVTARDFAPSEVFVRPALLACLDKSGTVPVIQAELLDPEVAFFVT